VSNGSPCADICSGPSLTFSDDLTCADAGYTSTNAGSVMKACLECESQSTYVDTTASLPQDNDQYWMLFNMKYTLQYCLTQTTDGTPNFSQCNSKCAGLYAALTPSWFTNPRPAQYDYCAISNDAFADYADQCASCLLASEGSVVLGNFIVMMKSGCDSGADAHTQDLIPLNRELFNTETVALSVSQTPTSSSATSSVTSDSVTSNTTPTATDTGLSASYTSSSTPLPSASSTSTSLSSGAAAGIGVGCGLGALAVGAGVLYLMRRRRQRKTTHSSMGMPPEYDAKQQPYSSSDSASKLYHQVHEAPGSATSREAYGHERYEAQGNQRYELG
jgi:hypothetical protein